MAEVRYLVLVILLLLFIIIIFFLGTGEMINFGIRNDRIKKKDPLSSVNETSFSLDLNRNGDVFLSSPNLDSSLTTKIKLRKTGSMYIENVNNSSYGENRNPILHLKRTGSINLNSNLNKLLPESKNTNTSLILSPKNKGLKHIFSDGETEYAGSVKMLDIDALSPTFLEGSSGSSPVHKNKFHFH